MPFEQQNQIDEQKQREIIQLKKDLSAILYGKEAESVQRSDEAEEKFWTEHRKEVTDNISKDDSLRAMVERYIATAKLSDTLRQRLDVTLQNLNKREEAVGAHKAFLAEMRAGLTQKSLSANETKAEVTQTATTIEKTSATASIEAKPETAQQKTDEALTALGKVFENTASDEALKKYAQELAKKPDWKNIFLSDVFGQDEATETQEATERKGGFGAMLRASALLDNPELAPAEMRPFLETFKKSAKELRKKEWAVEENLFPKGEDMKAFAKELWETPNSELCKRLVESVDLRLKLFVPLLGGGIPFEPLLADNDVDPKRFAAKFLELVKMFPKYLESLNPKPTIDPMREMLEKAGLKELEEQFKKQFPDVKDVHLFGWPFFGDESLAEKQQELTHFVEDLMKQPDWQKKIVEAKDKDFLEKLESLDYTQNRDINVPSELREFLSEWKSLQARLEQKAADYVLQLFPQRLEGVKAFIQEVEQMGQEKLKATLNDSVEFRYKFFVVINAAKAGKIATVLAGVKAPDFFKNFKIETLLSEKSEPLFLPTSQEASKFFEKEIEEWQKKYPQLQNANFEILTASYRGGAATDFGSYIGTSYGEQQNFEEMQKTLSDKDRARAWLLQENPSLADKKIDDVSLKKYIDGQRFVVELFPQGVADAVAFAKNLKTLPKEQLAKSFQEDEAFRAKANMVCEMERMIAEEARAKGYSHLLPKGSENFLGKDLQAVSKFFNGITDYVDKAIQPLKRDFKRDINKLWLGDDVMSKLEAIKAHDNEDPKQTEAIKALAGLLFESGAQVIIDKNIRSMLKRFPANAQFQQVMAEAENLPVVPASAAAMERPISSLFQPKNETVPLQTSTPSSAPTNSQQPPAAQVEKNRPGFITREMASQMSIGELFAKLIETATKLLEQFGIGSGLDKFLKGNAALQKTPEAAETKPAFSKEDLEKRKLDLQKDEEKVHQPDKSAEYAATVLGLGLSKNTENSATFLEAFQNSGMVLEQDWGKKTNLQIGDVLFFGKENAEKKAKIPYLTAVVCETQPRLKMKMVPAEGGKPVIMTVEESDFFKRSELMGFLHFLPQKPESDKIQKNV